MGEGGAGPNQMEGGDGAGLDQTELDQLPTISVDANGPCPATEEQPRRAMDMILSRIEARGEIFNSRYRPQHKVS